MRLPNCLSNILHRWSACYDNNRAAFRRIANRWTNIILSLHSQVVEFVELKRGWNAAFYIAHFRRNSAYLAALSSDSISRNESAFNTRIHRNLSRTRDRNRKVAWMTRWRESAAVTNVKFHTNIARENTLFCLRHFVAYRSISKHVSGTCWFSNV